MIQHINLDAITEIIMRFRDSRTPFDKEAARRCASLIANEIESQDVRRPDSGKVTEEALAKLADAFCKPNADLTPLMRIACRLKDLTDAAHRAAPAADSAATERTRHDDNKYNLEGECLPAATEQAVTIPGDGFFGGLQMKIDPTLPPDTMEMRGANTVRLNISTGEITEQPAERAVEPDIGDNEDFWIELSFVRLQKGTHMQNKRAEEFLVPFINAAMKEQRKAGWADGYQVAIEHHRAAAPASADVGELPKLPPAALAVEVAGHVAVYTADQMRERDDMWQARVAALQASSAALPKMDEDTARLDWLIAEGALLEEFGGGKHYRVHWPDLKEWQQEIHPDPRQAIDAARAALSASSSVLPAEADAQPPVAQHPI